MRTRDLPLGIKSFAPSGLSTDPIFRPVTPERTGPEVQSADPAQFDSGRDRVRSSVAFVPSCAEAVLERDQRGRHLSSRRAVSRRRWRAWRRRRWRRRYYCWWSRWWWHRWGDSSARARFQDHHAETDLPRLCAVGRGRNQVARGVAVPRRAKESASSRGWSDGGDCNCNCTSSSRSRYRAARAFHRARIAHHVDDEPFSPSTADNGNHHNRSAAGTTTESDRASAGIEALDPRTTPERDGRGETGSQGRRVEVPRQAGASCRRAIGSCTGIVAGANAGADCGSNESKPACCLRSERTPLVQSCNYYLYHFFLSLWNYGAASTPYI